MATKKTGASGKAAPLDPKVASKLLDKLSTDNEFRRLFKKDPKTALLAVGYKLPKGDTEAVARFEHLCGCSRVQGIAPKTAIIKAREALMQHFTSGLSQSPIHLNVVSSASRRTRK